MALTTASNITEYKQALLEDANSNIQFTSPQKPLHRTKSVGWLNVRSHLTTAFANNHNRIISFAVGVPIKTFRQWMSGHCRPPIGKLREIISFVERSERALHDARMWLLTELERREREPVKRPGFMIVKDHGDGLPPHNQRYATLLALGLVEPRRSRKRLDADTKSQKTPNTTAA